MVGGHAVGRLVLLEGSSATVVKEVDRDTSIATTVRRSELSVEVGEEVDVLTVVLASGQDTRHGNTDVGLGVCCESSVSDRPKKIVDYARITYSCQ